MFAAEQASHSVVLNDQTNRKYINKNYVMTSQVLVTGSLTIRKGKTMILDRNVPLKGVKVMLSVKINVG